jgi:PAS domain S-box-containing protein
MGKLILLNRALLLASGLVLFALAYRIYRLREKPTATSFSILLSLLGVTAFCTGVTATSGWPNKLIWLHTNLAIPVVLIYFSFDYYGIDAFRSPEWVAAIVTPTVFGSVGGSLLILGTPMVTPDGTVPVGALSSFPEVTYEFALTLDEIGYYYTTALILIAVGLVVRNVVQYEHLDTRLGLVIAFIGIWPWLGNFIMPQLQANVGQLAGLVSLATGYSLSALVAVLVVGPLGLFQSSPAAGNVGPELVLDSMDDAVVMVDDHEQVLRLNAVACTVLGIRESDAVGRTVADVFGKPVADLATEEAVSLETTAGTRQFETTRSAVVDRTDNERGSVIVLRDVTERLTREQRLAVLNRVLRHNLRNNANSILARAELISEDGQREEDAEQIIDTTKNLIGTAERAREIESMMGVERDGDVTPLQSTVGRVVEDVTDEYPDVEFTTALPDEAIADVDARTLETVLFNVVENGAEHNDADNPIVVISADYDDGTIHIAVSDNGPGIPDHERTVLDEGDEDQLQHGSGLGLWAVHWGITQMGGSFEITDNDPRGTTVTISVPATSTVDADEGTVEPVSAD